MLEIFGVSKSHGVERDGKGQRGFRGVKISEDSAEVFTRGGQTSAPNCEA